MKTKVSFLAASLLGWGCLIGNTQGFINLNFESARLVPAGSYYVQFNPAFPGWVGTVGGVQQTLALSNTVYLDTAGISIINSNFHDGFAPGGVLQGNYTAILQSGVSPTDTSMPADVSLSQTGLVPNDTQSLLFYAYPVFDSFGAFMVSLGGQNLSLIVVSNTLNYTVYGADVSAWAGQTAELSFTVFGENPHVNNEYLYLDNIQFSNIPVPEPGTWALLGMGGVVFGFLRGRARSSGNRRFW